MLDKLVGSWRSPVTITRGSAKYPSASIQEKIGGRRLYTESRRNTAIHIQQVREAQAVLHLVCPDRVGGFAHVDGNHRQALLLVLLMQRFESAPLPFAIASPGCPEIQKHHVAMERLQWNRFALSVKQFDRWQLDRLRQAHQLECLKHGVVHTPGTQ